VEKAENQLVIILTLHIDVVNADSTASVSENSANLDENSNCVGKCLCQIRLVRKAGPNLMKRDRRDPLRMNASDAVRGQFLVRIPFSVPNPPETIPQASLKLAAIFVRR